MNCPHSIGYIGPVSPAPPSAPFHKQRKSAWEDQRRIHMLPVAFGYAIRGWAVFPCKSREKKPLTEHGFKDATTELAKIRSFWEKWPDANVAIATGPASGLLVVDVDPRNRGNEQLAELEKRHGALPAGYVVETADGGRHYYFRLPDGVTIRCGQLAHGIDIKCEGGYVMAPPSVHPSGHRYRLEGAGDVRTMPDWLIAQLVNKEGAQAYSQHGPTISVDDLYISEDYKRLIREGVPKGSRSDNIFRVLRSMVMAGHTNEEVISVMMNPEYGLSEKPREKGPAWLLRDIKAAREKPDRDASSTWQGDDTASSKRYQSGRPSGARTDGSSSGTSQSFGSSQQARGSTPGFKFYSAAELKSLPPLEWLLSDLLVAGGFAVLYGSPGVGKSFLALDFALSIATNTQGVAEPLCCGPVAYIAAEGFGGLGKRVEAWEKAHGEMAENIYFLPEAVNLIDKTATGKLISAVQGLPSRPILIVIDTMARCLSGGDENSAKDVGQFVAMIDALRSALGCAVLVVHHGTKSDDEIERGSSALRGGADTMLLLQHKHGSPCLYCKKQKDGDEFPPLSLHLETIDLDDGKTSCVMRSSNGDATGPGTSPKEHEKAILEILAAIGESTYTELKDRFLVDTKRSKRTFDRALEKLIATGSIKKTEAGKYVLP